MQQLSLRFDVSRVFVDSLRPGGWPGISLWVARSKDLASNDDLFATSSQFPILVFPMGSVR